MTNEQKYKTPKERNHAFSEWCFNRDCVSCELKAHNFDGGDGCRFYWLALDAEVNKPVTDCNHLGNAAKMREALERIASMGEQIDHQLGSSEETVYAFRHERCLAHNISECARSVLAAPPRNCDVGTVEEQLDRYGLFCQNKCPMCEHRHSCHICGERYRMKCMVAWSQMTYE